MAKSPVDYVKSVNQSLKFGHVSEQFVCDIVRRMKPKQSSGYDDISNYLLKRLINVIKEPLTVVINKSLATGVFPDLMKTAKVVPLYKGRSQEMVDSY